MMLKTQSNAVHWLPAAMSMRAFDEEKCIFCFVQLLLYKRNQKSNWRLCILCVHANFRTGIVMVQKKDGNKDSKLILTKGTIKHSEERTN